MLEVLDRGAFAQELRIGHDGDIGIGPRLADDPLDLVAGADRHRRLGDDDGEAVERRGDLARRRVDVGEIGVAVAAPRRRADGDEDRVGLGDRAGEVGCETQALLAHIAATRRSRPGSKIGISPSRRAGRSCSASLSTQVTVMAEIGKAGPGHKPDIAGADHCDAHDKN